MSCACIPNAWCGVQKYLYVPFGTPLNEIVYDSPILLNSGLGSGDMVFYMFALSCACAPAGMLSG